MGVSKFGRTFDVKMGNFCNGHCTRNVYRLVRMDSYRDKTPESTEGLSLTPPERGHTHFTLHFCR